MLTAAGRSRLISVVQRNIMNMLAAGRSLVLSVQRNLIMLATRLSCELRIRGISRVVFTVLALKNGKLLLVRSRCSVAWPRKCSSSEQV